jgi:hypothetical protein
MKTTFLFLSLLALSTGLSACGSSSASDPAAGETAASLTGDGTGNGPANSGSTSSGTTSRGNRGSAGETGGGTNTQGPINTPDGTASSPAYPGPSDCGDAPTSPVPDDTAACSAGFDPNLERTRTCNSTFRGRCFESDAEACACAGCTDNCLIAESYPTQVSCGSLPAPTCAGGFNPNTAVDSEDVCNFVVNGQCFESGEDACACAGCAEEQCVILESYPAQVGCQ